VLAIQVVFEIWSCDGTALPIDSVLYSSVILQLLILRTVVNLFSTTHPRLHLSIHTRHLRSMSRLVYSTIQVALGTAQAILGATQAVLAAAEMGLGIAKGEIGAVLAAFGTIWAGILAAGVGVHNVEAGLGGVDAKLHSWHILGLVMAAWVLLFGILQQVSHIEMQLSPARV
jgi:hypothetical protein